MLFNITLFLYLAATIGYVSYLVTLKRGVSIASTAVLFVTFLLHAVTITLRYPELGHPPFIGIETLSFLAWTIVGIYLLVEWKFKVYVLGSIVSPIAFILLILTAVIPEGKIEVPPYLHSVWFPLHVGFAFLGNALFSLAFAAGVMYLIQERQVKRHHLGGIYKRLPSLEILDEINSMCLFTGFPLMTFGIMTGFAWSKEVWGTFLSLSPRAVSSLMTWLLYATLLTGRVTVGWRGRKAAVLAITGFSIMIVTYFAIIIIWGGHAFR
jgi:cytochrome c-type biogenesis protein CcsB